MQLSRLLAGACGAALLWLPGLGFAFDTICNQFANPNDSVENLTATQVVPGSRGCEGIEAARGRFRDPVKKIDEHTQLFKAAVLWAGLPPTLLETQTLTVLTHGLPVQGAVASVPSVTPWWSPAGESPPAFSAARRSFSLDEFAGLPDVSFGLWDWSGGNESCPVPVASPHNSAQSCHTFSSHMGPLNSNHFPPQSEQWYDHYHGLALDAARQCLVNRSLVWDTVPTHDNGETASAVDARMREFWKACEVEALAYEAVAQHFLQDSWSSGHMWQRWGTTDLTRYESFKAWGIGATAWNALPLSVQQLLIAEGVGMISGTIHGADAATFERGFSPHDPVSYPHPDVRAKVAPNSLPANGSNVVGDLHLHDLLGGLPGLDLPTHGEVSWLDPLPSGLELSFQANRLLDCVGGSLAEVYEALDDPEERFQPVLGDAPSSPMNFDRESCRTPMLTNLAFYTGLKANEGTFLPLPNVLDYYFGLLVYNVMGPIAASIESLPASYYNRQMNDYRKLYTAAAIRSKEAPDATDLAQNPPSLLRVKPNSAYLGAAPTPALADPPAVDGILAHSGNSETQAGKQSLAFHRSRATEFCYRPETFDVIDSLGETIRTTRRLPEDTAEQQAIKQAAIQACAEWVAPFVWNKDTWNTSDPDWQKHHYDEAPLCSYLPGFPFRGWVAPGREPYHYTLEDGTYLSGDWAAYPRRSQTNAIVAYDRATAYQGGQPTDGPEELARLMCGAPLDASDSGGFRIHGTLRNLHEDAFVGLFLRSSDAPPISSSTKIWAPYSNEFRPMYRRMGGEHDPAYAPWIEDEDRVLVRVYNPTTFVYVAVATDIDAPATAREGQIAYRSPAEDLNAPQHIALYAIHAGVRGMGDTHGGGGGLKTAADSQYYFNNSRRSLPATGSYVLTPMTPANALQHCTFNPSSVTLELSAAQPELFDVDFDVNCLPGIELRLTLEGNGEVRVGDDGLMCVSTGSETTECTFTLRGAVTLRVDEDGFSNWSGECSGSSTSCTVQLYGPLELTAHFDQ